MGYCGLEGKHLPAEIVSLNRTLFESRRSLFAFGSWLMLYDFGAPLLEAYRKTYDSN